MSKSKGKMALLVGLATAALGLEATLAEGGTKGIVVRQKTQLTPKQKKARRRNKAGIKARKNHNN